MQRLLLGMLLAVVCIVTASCGQKAPQAKNTELIALAQQFVTQMAQGDFAGATQTFDATMKQAMPPEKLQEAWNGLITQAGAFKEQTSTRTANEQGYEVVYVTCQFENSAVDVKVVFDTTKQISGLWFTPAQ